MKTFVLGSITVDDRRILIRNPIVFNVVENKKECKVYSKEYNIVGYGRTVEMAIEDAVEQLADAWDNVCFMIERSKGKLFVSNSVDSAGMHMSEFDDVEKLMTENFVELNF